MFYSVRTVDLSIHHEGKVKPISRQAEKQDKPHFDLVQRLLEVTNCRNKAELARHFGIEKASVYGWETGSFPRMDLLIRLCEEKQVNLHWIIFNEGPKFRFQNNQQSGTPGTETSEPVFDFDVILRRYIEQVAREDGITFERAVQRLVMTGLTERGLINSGKPDDIVLIPLGGVFPMRVSMLVGGGPPVETFEIDEWVMVPEEYRGRDLFVARVRGDSMIEAGIDHDSKILCERVSNVRNGQIVVALVDGDESTVKTIERDRNIITLVPANDRYRPQVYEQERVQILGIVILVMKKPG